MLLKALCQNVVNELQGLDYGNIGMIVFARRDMISNAIDTNVEQFRSMYYNYELNWTQTEALRLALWIASKGYPDLTDGIDVLNATRSVLTYAKQLDYVRLINIKKSGRKCVTFMKF